MLSASIAETMTLTFTTTGFDYYPRIDAVVWSWGYITYPALLLMPMILEVEQVILKLDRSTRRPALSPAMQALYGRTAQDAADTRNNETRGAA